MRSSIYAVMLPVLVLLLLASLALSAAAQETWMQAVGLPVDGYTGKNVLVVIVSTGIDIRNPEIAKRLLETGGVACAVAFDSQGNMYTPTGITPSSIGTDEALEVVNTAPSVKLALVELPYTLDARGLPSIPAPALRAALEWLLNPWVEANGTQVQCDFSRFAAVIVLLGLPVYSNYTLDPGTASLLEKLVSRYLVVTPVGDVGPGILNVLAKKIGVVSVGWTPLAGGAELNGHSGGFWLETPHGEYRDVPLAPSYSIPVNPADCAIGYTVDATTCSEIAAARFAGLAAVLAEAYYDLVGSPPLPYELEHLIRASVYDKGVELKDTLYGWGVPNAQVAYKLLYSNSGFRICAPSYAASSPALVELSGPEGLRYGVILYPGECVRVRALPSIPYTIRVYGPATLDPGYTVASTAPGYYRKIEIPPKLSLTVSVTGRVVNEKGVTLSGEALLLPGDLTLVNAIQVNALLHPVNFTHGDLNLVLSLPYLKALGGAVYLVVRPWGYLARIYKLPTTPSTLALGTQVFVEAPSVYLLGEGPGAEETRDLLELMGLNVTMGSSPIPPPGTSVVVVHPSLASLAWQVLGSGRGVVLLGGAAEAVHRGVHWQAALPQTVFTGSVAYTPGYQPLLAGSNIPLLRLYGYSTSAGGENQITIYNITLAPAERLYAELYSLTGGAAGKIVEVAFDPRSRTAYVANLWSYWGTRLGAYTITPRSLLASGSPLAYAVLQLAVEAAAHPVWVSLNKSVVRVGDVIGVSVWGWRLAATIWMESIKGLQEVETVKALYPGYYANLTLRVPMEPYGTYRVIVNDSLWALAEARYTVVPYLEAIPSRTLAGGTIELIGTGFPAATTLQVLFDGVAVYSILSGPLGNFTSIIRVPSVVEPGEHQVSVVAGGVGASVHIIVVVRRALDVKVAVPPVIPEGSSAEGAVLVTLDGQRVDANVTVYLGGHELRSSRAARGVYVFNIPSLPPGSYTVLVVANYNSSLVVAHGEAVAPLAVVRVPRSSIIAGYVEKILERYFRIYNESLAGLQSGIERLDSRLTSLESSLASLNKSIGMLSVKFDEKINTILGEIRKSVSELSRGINSISTRIADLDASVRRLEERIVAGVKEVVAKDLMGIEAKLSTLLLRVESGIRDLKSISSSLLSLKQQGIPLTMLYAMLGLLVANLVAIALIFVVSRRR